MTTEILAFKTKLRHFERCWRSRQLAIDFEIFQTHLFTYLEMLKASRSLFFSSEVRQCRGDMRALYLLRPRHLCPLARVIKKLLTT